MIKVFDNLSTSGSYVFRTIANSFLNYMPHDKFKEVEDVNDCDVILMRGDANSNSFRAHMGRQIDLSNLSDRVKIYNSMATKRRIFYLDTKGPDIIKDANIFDFKHTGLSDRDILVSPVSLPDIPNSFTHVYAVPKNTFWPRKRFERQPYSVVMLYDHVTTDAETLRITTEILDAVSHLYIVGVRHIDEEVKKMFGKNIDKVSINILSYPEEVAHRLSKADFVLATRKNIGIEFMNIEGGMCGCQPIYPDTEFYRDAFDNTGVVFYDLDNPVDSLKSIISQGSTFTDEQVEVFREKFSAEDNLPDFWDHVFAVLNGSN